MDRATEGKGKNRADQMMVAAGLARTRSQARALIMAGKVLANGQRIDKAGEMLSPDSLLTLKEPEGVFASRGGFKLEGALKDFDLDVQGWTVLDIGASTGGFTDCLLKKGASRVTAVDVGYGILDWRLRQDARVTVLERTNARNLTADQVKGPFHLVVIDVSFISLKLILTPVFSLLEPEGLVLALVKPQFEVGREKVGRGGVVRDPEVRMEAVSGVAEAAARCGFLVHGHRPSCLKGPKGNQEYFLFLEKVRSASEKKVKDFS